MTSLVRDVMTCNVVALRKQAEFGEVIEVLRAQRFSAFPVIDASERVIGIVSGGDLLVKERYSGAERAQGMFRHRADRAPATGLTAADLMSRPAVTIGPAATVAEAAHIMHTRRVRRLPVVTEDGRLTGIVSRTDLLGVYDRPDENIGREILDQVVCGQFMLDKLRFTATVQAGVVTVSGPVETESVALGLLNAIRHVTGVVALRDRLHCPRSCGPGLAGPGKTAGIPSARKELRRV